MRRASFVGSLGMTAAALVSASRVAYASGARSGAWCKPLTPFARDHAFDFSLELMDGGVFTVSEHLGKPVWLSFFTTWCPPCNEEAGDIVRLAQKYGDAAAIIAFDEMEKPAKVRAFAERHAFTLPIAMDTTGSVFDALGFKSYPTHLFLAPSGEVSCLSVGDLTPEQMDNELAVALARPARNVRS